MLLLNEDPGLREQLLAAQSHPPGIVPPPEMRPSASASPNENQIDPAIAGTGYGMNAGDSGGDDAADGSRKGKRELSTSKRAAQNRAAQVSHSTSTCIQHNGLLS